MPIPHPPRIVLFDWHGTLADTNAAMYLAMDDMLAQIDGLGLRDRLQDAASCRTDDDRRLVAYVRAHRRLHPNVVARRRASRTDLLEVLFGHDEGAKAIANREYNQCYRRHFGDVRPFRPGVRDLLEGLRGLGIKQGILTNRAREFLDKELATVEAGSWVQYFDNTLSGTETKHLKPSPFPVIRALQDFDAEPGNDVWYLGDSKSDTISAKAAGVVSIFFNGAHADAEWIARIFPGDAKQPHRPDWIVNSYEEFLGLVKLSILKDREGDGSTNLER